ncbi:unnamed protein product [marine sediment metagenome]|uniref:HNH nuclease domain-containing protein n=1 Tax=marine sediment metagenome TaxID=412755 RepID=X0T389_9ZZZZ
MSYKNKEKQREYQRKWRRNKYIKERKIVLKLFGGKCVLCGNSDERVLEIDHIKPLIRKNSKELCGSLLIHAIIFRKVDVKNLQLLCSNCHRIKTFDDRKQYKNYK